MAEPWAEEKELRFRAIHAARKQYGYADPAWESEIDTALATLDRERAARKQAEEQAEAVLQAHDLAADNKFIAALSDQAGNRLLLKLGTTQAELEKERAARQEAERALKEAEREWDEAARQENKMANIVMRLTNQAIDSQAALATVARALWSCAESLNSRVENLDPRGPDAGALLIIAAARAALALPETQEALK